MWFFQKLVKVKQNSANIGNRNAGFYRIYRKVFSVYEWGRCG